MAPTPAKLVSYFARPKETLGDMDAETAARAMAAATDVALIVDDQGIIRDIALSGPGLARDIFAGALDRRWADTVTLESRPKVEEMLRVAGGDGDLRWREINHMGPEGSLPLRCVALEVGTRGHVLVLARDLRDVASLQQKLLQAQQTMERDYARMRQTESRYRLTFRISSEAVVIADCGTKKITDANPAAASVLGIEGAIAQGQVFARLFHPDSRDAAAALLSDSLGAAKAESVRLRTADGRAEVDAAVSLFRSDGSVQALVRLAKVEEAQQQDSDQRSKLLKTLNRIPDAFILAGDDLTILETNLAFLELTQIANAEAARGQAVGRFLGRPGIDFAVLLSNLKEHGWVRNFVTVARTAYGAEEDVELSAVTFSEGLETLYGFVLRPVRRRAAPAPSEAMVLPRTGDQLRDLVGRVSLKEIVRETTDVIERLCIEAALGLTGNNRAAAAEMLGLSRQSLYSKLNRFGIAGPEGDGGNAD
jgi:transcriptional regulator PpsR